MLHEASDSTRVLTRREALTVLGVSGGALAAGWWALDARAAQAAQGGASAVALPACVVRPEQTEGPYFLDTQLDRSDIRAEPSTGVRSEGVPLTLTFNLSRIAGGTCGVLAGALVDVWQCDATGAYSGFTDGRAGFQAEGLTFLRGYQRTDANGVARFTTIYPGWYTGRAVHVHFKVRTDVAGQPYEFTTQLYFDEALTDQVHALAPYAVKGRREMTTAADFIFRDGGESLMPRMSETGGGYAGVFDLGLDLGDAAAGHPDGFGGRGRGVARRGRGPGA